MSWYLAEWYVGKSIDGRDAFETWISSSLLLGIQFTIMTSLLTIFDLIDPLCWRKRLLASYHQPHPKLTIDRVQKMLPIVLRNYLISAFYIWVLWNIRIATSPKRPQFTIWLDTNVDPIFSYPIQIVWIHVMSQLWFWSAHRFVHSFPMIYKYVHAAHHIYTEPFALTAIDCSVSEMLILNIPAVVLPLLILQPNLHVQYIWMFLAASHVPLTHSGHELINGYAADTYHARHHQECRYNFGSKFLDQLFDCYKAN